MFENLKMSSDVEAQVDRLGGSYVVDTDVYEMTVDMAYVEPADSGALGLHITLVNPESTIRQTLWMTSGTAKGGKNYSEKNGKKRYLQGFLNANDLCLMTIDKPVAELTTEEKVINVYDFNERKEVPQAKQVATELLNKTIKVGIVRQVVDKNAKGADGQYHPTGETREENDIDKFFHNPTGLTVVEAQSGMKEGVFIHQWLEKNKGVTRQRATGAAGGATGASTGAAAAQAAVAAGAGGNVAPATQKSSLFTD